MGTMASLRAGACATLGACLCVAASVAQSDPPPTNVPDAITRQSGLRLEPMSRPARIYALNCQGCHGHLGVSVPEIPALAGRIGYFVRIPEGRRYIVQVPNVALNPSSDEDIAEMLNWALVTYSRAQLPPGFRPYTAEEIGRLRKERIDVNARRRQIVDRLLALKQVPSAKVLAIAPAARY